MDIIRAVIYAHTRISISTDDSRVGWCVCRKIGGLVLAAFLTLIVGLLIIAVLLGVLCHGTRSQFHEQSVASKIVSLLLIA